MRHIPDGPGTGAVKLEPLVIAVATRATLQLGDLLGLNPNAEL
jgi:hypothetical protein